MKQIPKGKQGFASMSREKQREIAAKGGRAAHEKGTAHEWTTEEAQRAGRKGGIISRGGQGRLAVAVLLLMLLAGSARADSINLVNNGDFNQGAVGFGTDYALVGHSALSLWPDGVYTVDTSADIMHPLWEQGGDHTGGGNFMLVNGRTDGPSTVWSQTISTTTGWAYDFSLWAKSLCCTAANAGLPGPQLSFWVNGLEFGSALTDGPGVWEPFSGTFLATSDSALLQVRNGSTVYSGNDFGLDDIEVVPTPEPASLALLGTGLLVAAWKRQRARA